jgi:transposase
MLAFPAGLRVFLASEAVDMRKQYNGLWTEALERLQEDPRQGAVFAFTNKSRDRLKLLYWDGTGVCILSKRLEKGRFTWPAQAGVAKVQLQAEVLGMIMAGIDMTKTTRKKWFN